jgi:hypothetical protein
MVREKFVADFTPVRNWGTTYATFFSLCILDGHFSKVAEAYREYASHKR